MMHRHQIECSKSTVDFSHQIGNRLRIDVANRTIQGSKDFVIRLEKIAWIFRQAAQSRGPGNHPGLRSRREYPA